MKTTREAKTLTQILRYSTAEQAHAEGMRAFRNALRPGVKPRRCVFKSDAGRIVVYLQPGVDLEWVAVAGKQFYPSTKKPSRQKGPND